MKSDDKKTGYKSILHQMERTKRTSKQKTLITGEEVVGGLNTAVESAAHNDKLAKLAARQGHGYAGEQYNDLLDKIHGHDAVIVGDDNTKNGPDRLVDSQYIQTKYCQTAKASVDAAFKNNQYRYIDKNGNLQQLEVPSDQYKKAVEVMEKKIAEGKVPGIKNPKDAEKIVRKGNVTYQQAVNLTKAGTIDSLKFDMAHGTVICGSALGISGVLTYAKALWDGEESVTALDKAVLTGLQMGGIAFATSVISAQISRTSINTALLDPSIAIVKLLPTRIRHEMIRILKDGASIYGGAATNSLAKLVRCNVITAAVTMVVMSAGDIRNAFNSRISGKQLFKNMLILGISLESGGAVALCGGALGTAAGAAIGGPAGAKIGAKVGMVAGGAAGGAVGGHVSSKVLDRFIEDDAVEMVRIINNRFVIAAQDYVLTAEEIEVVLGDLKLVLEQNMLLDMFASNDRIDFADNMIVNLIEKVIRVRARILAPMDEDIIQEIGHVLKMASDGKSIMPEERTRTNIAVEMGKQLLGKELKPSASLKAMYMTKQMNLTQIQAEGCLKKIKKDNIKAKGKNIVLYEQRKDLKLELNLELNNLRGDKNEY